MISRAAQPLDADTERELVAKGANRLRMMSLLETHHEQSAIARATAKHGRRLAAPQAKQVLGGVAIVVVAVAIAVPVTLSCPADPNSGGGELSTSGSSSAVSASFLAPVFLNGGVDDIEGTIEGPLVWWGGCGAMLDCGPCPPKFTPGAFTRATSASAYRAL